MESYGSGDMSFGCFGGLMDAATGLLYVGNGQYYDPRTRRFLTREARPGQKNPYVPWDPIGALLAPLGLLALIYGRRKRKPGKWGAWLVILIFLSSISLSLASCGGNQQEESGTVIVEVEFMDKPGTWGYYEATFNEDNTISGLKPIPAGPPDGSPKYHCFATPIITPTGTATPTPTPTYLGEFFMSAYYIPLEGEYTDVNTRNVPIPADTNSKINSGYFADQKNVYLSSQGPHHYNDDGEDYWQHANWRFLNDPDGVCMQGTGKLENDWYISCTTPQGDPNKEFSWQLDEKVNRLEKSVVELETVAVCGYLTEEGGSLPFGTEISIPEVENFMQSYGKDATFIVRDTGDKLCPEISGRSHQTIDLFVGEGKNAFKIYENVRDSLSSAPVKVYK